MTPFTGWGNFYVIVGSFAGALIGLQFVAITLIAGLPIRDVAEGSSAFATPTVVHFSVALLLSAVLNIPWSGVRAAAVFWGVVGLTGIVYEIVVVRRMRLQSAYQPEFEDWLFHVLLPVAAYSGLAVSACTAISHMEASLFVVAASALLLLFIGIHNAWDTVTYHAFAVKTHAPQDTESS